MSQKSFPYNIEIVIIQITIDNNIWVYINIVTESIVISLHSGIVELEDLMYIHVEVVVPIILKDLAILLRMLKMVTWVMRRLKPSMTIELGSNVCSMQKRTTILETIM